MNRIFLGLICGLAFGVLDAVLMLPLSFPDKRLALAGAFLDRFAIGFLICVLLADKRPREKAEELARLLSEGTWTHDHPITYETPRVSTCRYGAIFLRSFWL
jgi:hypothetical protein